MLLLVLHLRYVFIFFFFPVFSYIIWVCCCCFFFFFFYIYSFLLSSIRSFSHFFPQNCQSLRSDTDEWHCIECPLGPRISRTMLYPLPALLSTGYQLASARLTGCEDKRRALAFKEQSTTETSHKPRSALFIAVTLLGCGEDTGRDSLRRRKVNLIRRDLCIFPKSEVEEGHFRGSGLNSL